MLRGRRALSSAVATRAGLRLGAPLLIIVLGFGCAGPEPGASTAREQQPLFGGSASTGLDRAVAALVLDGQVQCTGALVAPSALLTAAHCLPFEAGEIDAPKLQRLTIAFGDTVSEPIASAGVQDAWLPPEQNVVRSIGDVALLRLSSKVLVEPLPLLTSEDEAPWAGEVVRLAGFGADDSGNTGEKREGPARIDAVTNTHLRIATAESGPCPGDSGGPLFATRNGREVIVGVTARSDCASSAEATRLEPYLDQIQLFADARAPEGTLGCRLSGIGARPECEGRALLAALTLLCVLGRARRRARSSSTCTPRPAPELPTSKDGKPC